MVRKCLVLASLIASITIQAAVTIDVMFAYDQSAAKWLNANEVDGSNLAVRVVERMISVWPATHLDEHFSFRLAGVMTSAAEATGTAGGERLANVCQSVANAKTGAATGAWKDIHSARDRFGADVVVVLVDSNEEGDGAVSDGVSWSMGKSKINNLSEFAPWAYSVCGIQDVDRSHVVVHEVGHVMGAGHSDLLVDGPGPQLYPYSSAYHFTDVEGNKRHTIMGYPYTSASDFGYRLYPAFSSAEFTTPEGDALGDANHDNTRTLRETCVAVSQFRITGNEGGEIAPAPSPIPSPSAQFMAKIVVPCKVVDAADRAVGVAQITVAKTDQNGQSKVSAVFYGLDGKKKSAKPVKARVSLSDVGAAVKDVHLDVKGESAPFIVSVAEDGSATGTLGSYSIKQTVSVAEPSANPRFRIMGMPNAINGMTVMNDVESNGNAYHLLPDGEGIGFSVSGKKWVFAKAASVKYTKNKSTLQTELLVDVGKDGSKTNLCGLKLVVNAKTGVFKGSFTIYVKAGTPEKPKAKQLKFKVSGILVDGVGSGHAAHKSIIVDATL